MKSCLKLSWTRLGVRLGLIFMCAYRDGVAVVTYEFQLFKCYESVEKYGVADVTCKTCFHYVL